MASGFPGFDAILSAIKSGSAQIIPYGSGEDAGQALKLGDSVYPMTNDWALVPVYTTQQRPWVDEMGDTHWDSYSVPSGNYRVRARNDNNVFDEIVVGGDSSGNLNAYNSTVYQTGSNSGGFFGSTPFGGALNDLVSMVKENPVLPIAINAVLPGAGAVIQAANAIDSGNVAAAASALANIPGASDLAGSDLTSAIKTVAQTANVVNALESGNTLGALTSGASLTGSSKTEIGDTGVTVGDALKAANLVNAVNTGNTSAAVNILSSLSGQTKDQSKDLLDNVMGTEAQPTQPTSQPTTTSAEPTQPTLFGQPYFSNLDWLNFDSQAAQQTPYSPPEAPSDYMFGRAVAANQTAGMTPDEEAYHWYKSYAEGWGDPVIPTVEDWKKYGGNYAAYQADLNHKTIMDTFHSVLGRDPTPEEYQKFSGENSINIKNTLDRQTLDEWKIAAGEGYNLGQGSATDRYGFTAEQKQNISDFLKSSVKYSDSGIRLDPNTGEYIVNDPTNNLSHKFSSDGAYLGNVPYISGSGAKEEIGDEANALLSSVSPIINAATAGKDVTGGTSSGDTSKTDTTGTQTTPMGDISSSEGIKLKEIGSLLGLGTDNPDAIKQTLLGSGATGGEDGHFSLIAVDAPLREQVLNFIIPDLQKTDLPDSEKQTLQEISDKIRASLEETKQQEKTDTTADQTKTDVTQTKITGGGGDAGGGGDTSGGGETGGGQTETVVNKTEPADDASAQAGGWYDYSEYTKAKEAGYNNPIDYRAAIATTKSQTVLSGTSGEVTGGSGVSGMSGYSGISGESGLSGYSGISGLSGYSGISGESGLSGYSGISGLSGYSGISGESGISGYSGISGESGYSGISGSSGYSGTSGVSGFSGFSGLRGLTGVPGVDASVGTFGSQFGSAGTSAVSTPVTKLEHQVLTSKQTPYHFVSPLAAVLALSNMGGSEENQANQGALQMQTPHYNYGNISSIDEILGMPEYFSGLSQPAQEEQAAQGGLMTSPLMAAAGGFAGTTHGRYAGGGLSNKVVHHSGKARVDFRTGDAVTGPGDGQSDDIPAMLADGEFVFPADVVAAIGNGSTKAGSDKLYDMMHGIRAHVRSAKPKDLPPEIKSPLDFLGKKYRKG